MVKQQRNSRNRREGRGGNKPYEKENLSLTDVLVSNLSDRVTQAKLLKGFEEAGPVVSVKLIRGSKGIVVYKTKKDAAWARSNYDQTKFHGSVVKVERARKMNAPAPKKHEKTERNEKSNANTKAKGKGKGKGKGKDAAAKKEKPTPATAEELDSEMDSYWNKVPEKAKANLDAEMDAYFAKKPEVEQSADSADADVEPEGAAVEPAAETSADSKEEPAAEPSAVEPAAE